MKEQNSNEKSHPFLDSSLLHFSFASKLFFNDADKMRPKQDSKKKSHELKHLKEEEKNQASASFIKPYEASSNEYIRLHAAQEKQKVQHGAG